MGFCLLFFTSFYQYFSKSKKWWGLVIEISFNYCDNIFDTRGRHMKNENLKGFFSNKKNIYALIAIIAGVLAVILFIVLPAIQITLTPDGRDIARMNADTIPEMSKYHEVLGGSNVLFGVGTYTVWKNVGTTAVKETQQLQFNIPMLVGLILLLLSAGGLTFLTITKKNNIANKFVLAGFIIGAIMLLLSPIWFYAVNPIVASTRYTPTKSIYEYGSVNAHAHAGPIVSGLLGIVASVFSGMLIIHPESTR